MTSLFRRLSVLAPIGGATSQLPVVKRLRPTARRSAADRPVAQPSTRARSGGERPLYARLLRLRHIEPGGLLCFIYFEGAVGMAVLLVLAEFVPWLAIPVLPVTVAAIVKINDVIAGGPRIEPDAPFPSRAAAALGASYHPHLAYALEAAPVRPALYGTPVHLELARGTASVDSVPKSVELVVSTVYQSTSALYGAPAEDGPVPIARAEQEPYQLSAEAAIGRHGRSSGSIYHTTPR